MGERQGEMRYALTITLLGLAQFVLAAVYGGRVALFLLWSGVSFLVAGFAYACHESRWMGKRSDGSVAVWQWLLMLPYLGLNALLWFFQTRLGREAAWHPIGEGLWLGRRVVKGRELPPEATLVVDLTAEFAAPQSVREGRDYCALPILDYQTPTLAQLQEIVTRILRQEGGVYIHCALGHGRSALIAAAVLIQRGMAADAEQAETQLRQARPGVRLNPSQRALLEQFVRDRVQG